MHFVIHWIGIDGAFPKLACNFYLVFSVKSTVTAKKIKLNKKKIEIRFAYSKYKVQGATFEFATLDLRRKAIKKTAESHKQFCFIYVQLSQLQSLKGVSLLEPNSLDDINNQPHHKLQTDDKELQKLENIMLLLFINTPA